MKNKKIITLIITILVVLAIVICCILLKQKANKETYTIKEWSTQAQTVSIEIEDETMINVVKSKEADQEGTKTGGEYTLFTITGLKKGTTSAIVNIINEDGSVESSKKYHLEVSNDLKVDIFREQN